MNKFRPRTTEKQRENGRRTIRFAIKAATQNSQLQRARRLKQIENEERMAEKLRQDGYEVYSPTVVCDRIAVKNGKVLFVEFKKFGQQLREGQQRICDLVGEMYKVIYE